jgi:hypothetical protein
MRDAAVGILSSGVISGIAKLTTTFLALNSPTKLLILLTFLFIAAFFQCNLFVIFNY